jgi:hypothetical protein
MLHEDYQLLKFVNTLDEVNTIIKEHQVSKYRTSALNNQTKYSYRCSHYRKYLLCRYEIQDKTRAELLGKRRTGRSKKVKSALSFH